MRGIASLAAVLASIGVIGGADGPTVVFVTAGEGWWIMLLLMAAIAAAVVWLIVRTVRKRRRG